MLWNICSYHSAPLSETLWKFLTTCRISYKPQSGGLYLLPQACELQCQEDHPCPDFLCWHTSICYAQHSSNPKTAQMLPLLWNFPSFSPPDSTLPRPFMRSVDSSYKSIAFHLLTPMRSFKWKLSLTRFCVPISNTLPTTHQALNLFLLKEYFWKMLTSHLKTFSENMQPLVTTPDNITV